MEISFYGAAEGVTGSQHLVKVNGKQILLDCGLYQGQRDESFMRNRTLPYDASKVDVMVLSHAHIDHSGNLPNLVASGYHGPIYATSATRDLCNIMLRDSARIMREDTEYLNSERRKSGQPLLTPTYSMADTMQALSLFHSLEYQTAFEIAPGVRLTFYDAGHILGSAVVLLEVDEENRHTRLLYSGDLGRNGMLLLRDPVIVPNIDYLILESTYGARKHPPIEQAEAQLGEIVRETIKRRGKVIIPSFSVGRTQELVYALHRLNVAGRIPKVPIYVDSPMAFSATEVFRLHPESFDKDTYDFMTKHQDPFSFDNLHYVRRAKESAKLTRDQKAKVVISASGMAEFGRILQHLARNIGDKRNTVLFVGYQAEDTLGTRIKAGDRMVPILGSNYRVRAQVCVIDAFSAHADQTDLVNYVRGANGHLRQIFLVHGELEGIRGLKTALGEAGFEQVTIPKLGETVRLVAEQS